MIRAFTYIAQLKHFLRRAAQSDTSSAPDTWTAANPLWGHCAVASAIAQKIFGGDLLRYDLKGTKFEFMGSHYSNRLSYDRLVDFTASQFSGENPCPSITPTVRERSTVLDPVKYPKVVARYKQLFWRVLGARYPENGLFDDGMYHQCFLAALDSDCAKMHFGCAFVHEGKIVHVDANRKIPAIAHRCEPECIRTKITSRTESMIGACSHAEEGLLRDVANMGIKPNEVEMYVAGFYPDMTPWLKTVGEHTCIRCSTAMHLAGVKAVYVPVDDHWQAVDLSTMLEHSFAYALGEKKV
ncbi:MAG: hypothetical protein Q8R25_00845 [bacterium]|nr:hypothetical protein [bacterium]